MDTRAPADAEDVTPVFGQGEATVCVEDVVGGEVVGAGGVRVGEVGEDGVAVFDPARGFDGGEVADLEEGLGLRL